jgi:hypothetical protein
MIVSTWSVSKKGLKNQLVGGFLVVIIIDLYKGHAASFRLLFNFFSRLQV